MRIKRYLLLVPFLVLTIASFIVIAYSSWKIEHSVVSGFVGYDVSSVDGVTVTNTNTLNIKVFGFENDTVAYTINSNEKSNLIITLEIVDETILNDFIESVELNSETLTYQIVDGKVRISLTGLTLNTNHTLEFRFSNKAIYNNHFNTSGVLNSNSKTLLTVYNGE